MAVGNTVTEEVNFEKIDLKEALSILNVSFRYHSTSCGLRLTTIMGADDSTWPVKCGGGQKVD